MTELASDTATTQTEIGLSAHSLLAAEEVKVHGEKLEHIPAELYVPPDALVVFLEAFEGPLDLLLYLIRKNNLDILDIPVADVTDQYMKYIELMKDFKLELAGDYLVMAALLATIKSQMLLPRQPDIEEDDPRAELARRLQEYEVFKRASECLDELPRLERDIYVAKVFRPQLSEEKQVANVDLSELISVLAEMLARAKFAREHEFNVEGLSVRARMAEVLERMNETIGFVLFSDLFRLTEGRLGIAVTFLALLELLRGGLLEIVQSEPFAPIYVRNANT